MLGQLLLGEDRQDHSAAGDARAVVAADRARDVVVFAEHDGVRDQMAGKIPVLVDAELGAATERRTIAEVVDHDVAAQNLGVLAQADAVGGEDPAETLCAVDWSVAAPTISVSCTVLPSSTMDLPCIGRNCCIRRACNGVPSLPGGEHR